MGRSRRRRPEHQPLNVLRARGGAPMREHHRDGDWFVRQVTGTDAGRWYRCPGCHQELAATTAHTVAWPADGLGGIDDRRHWHNRCWQVKARRSAL